MRITLQQIFGDHWASYLHPRSRRLLIGPFAGTYLIPAILAGVSIAAGFVPTADMLTGILTAYSIFFGLLFNLLVFNLDFVEKAAATNRGEKAALRLKLIKQTHANITYSTIIALATVILALLLYAAPSLSSRRLPVGLTGFMIWTSFHFLLTGMGVLRRVYAISKDLVADPGNH